MPSGKLLVQINTASAALPVEGTQITVINAQGETVYEEIIGPGSGGKSSVISLDAPDKAYSLTPNPRQSPYSLYTVVIENPSYFPQYNNEVQIFDSIETVLPVELLPLPESLESEDLVFFTQPHALQQVYTPRVIVPESRILGEVIIPETITVHLGTPNSSATNVTVSFPDYIKNVASSEIYPTWPESSLRANILAQISLVLNRVYTEWYRSRGYNFDITNSTAYDQYFVYGRNIYTNISNIVDDIFNNYIRKPNRVEPFYAEYCNGSTVTCPGMSQWGTVSLANQGLSPVEILKFYYGDVVLTSTNNIRGVESSYPGSPLSIGSSGASVRTIQEQLDRIAINYPIIPLVQVDAVYGEATAASVRAFQRQFNLTPDGIVGKATWYKLSYIYTSVKKLAELTSEGQRPEYNKQLYPGYPLSQGSRGLEVQEIQFYLSRIARFNPAVRTVGIDGRFGAATKNSVISFQEFYGLNPDGIVGPATWRELVNVYNGTIDNVEEPDVEIPLQEYPGYTISRGARGENTAYIQALLAKIRVVFAKIPSLAIDGVFGAGTQSSVTAFQSIFGLTPDGVVGALTWNRLNEVYTAVASGCIYDESGVPNLLPYPNTLIRQGSSGSNVRYIQNKLNSIRRVLVQIPSLAVDGSFGAATRNAVVIFQGILGLVQDGIVGKATWETLNYIYSSIYTGCLPVANYLSALPTVLETEDELREAALYEEVMLNTDDGKAEEDEAFIKFSLSKKEEKSAEKEASSSAEGQKTVKADEKPSFFEERIAEKAEKEMESEDIPASAPSGNSVGILKLGCFGKEVLRCKGKLSRTCPSGLLALSENFLFGEATERAVKEFQKMNSLPVTGIIDAKTKALLKD